MSKIKIGSVEIMGYIGIIIWLAVFFCREYTQWNNNTYLFLLGILPNLGAAWAITMLGKWVVIFSLKRDITMKLHLFICLMIFTLAIISEIVHDLFLNSPFDIYDIVITAISQILMFGIPIVIKDKYFSNYNDSNR